jgi:histidine ammonia-lyase
VRRIITTELNASTDNPVILARHCNRAEECVLKTGNFHGEYIAKAADYLCIAVHELANISERRIERLCNPQLSKLPAFLTK